MIVENIMWLWFVLIAGSYYLFSNEFFKFVADIKAEKIAYRVRFLSFFIVYTWFTAASIMELPLVVNWLVFCVILGLEVHVVFRYDYVVSYSVSLFCVIMGLAVNVFFRSLVAIMLKMPLSEFDQQISNLKTYPILIGFVVMAVLLCVLRRRGFTSKLERMLNNRESLLFYAWTEVFIYVFLMIQLLLFTVSGDSVDIKIWGIKAALFSIITLIIANIYSLRVASLHYYMDKQHEMRVRLIQEKEDINKLWTLAFTDILTGCSNRQLLNKRLEEYAGYGGSVTLAFIDVNGLKTINDQYGHMEGDNYLFSVSKILLKVIGNRNIDLFRYGGDEFVMMSNTCCEEEITRLLEAANELLKKDDKTPYTSSISYGVVYGECMDYQKLIKTADDIMYKHKVKHYEDMVRA